MLDSTNSYKQNYSKNNYKSKKVYAPLIPRYKGTCAFGYEIIRSTIRKTIRKTRLYRFIGVPYSQPLLVLLRFHSHFIHVQDSFMFTQIPVLSLSSTGIFGVRFGGTIVGFRNHH